MYFYITLVSISRNQHFVKEVFYARKNEAFYRLEDFSSYCGRDEVGQSWCDYDARRYQALMFNLYSVRDLNCSFNQPFCEKNDSLAIRGFSYAMNNNDIMGFRPTDFELFLIGSFDEDKGELESVIPTLICRGGDVVAS